MPALSSPSALLPSFARLSLRTPTGSARGAGRSLAVAFDNEQHTRADSAPKAARRPSQKGCVGLIAAYSTGMDMADEDQGPVWWKPHPDDLRENLGIGDKVWWYPDGDAHDETASQRIKATITSVNNLYASYLPRTFDLRLHDPDKTIVEDVPMEDVEWATWGGVGAI